MFIKSALLVSVVAALAACGGGASTPANPVPTVTLSLTKAKTTVGSETTLSWTSTNATSCSGLDSFTGAKAVTGSEIITPTVGGQFTYTVSCVGAGGTAKQSAALVVPMPVLRSSYENKMVAGKMIGPQIMPKGTGFAVNEAITAGWQLGDFFQDGTIAMVAASNVFAGQNGFGSTVAGRIYFFHTDGKGGWIDQTDKLLSVSDRTGCISPRKVIVADFNGDGKPDLFIACHGIDGNIPTGYSQGEHPRYLLSQTDGGYKNIDAGFNCYCHSAAAVDLSGNGFADVVVASPPILGRLAYLKNNKNGTFTDAITMALPSTNQKSIWSLEFIDINNDGKYDLATAGSSNTVAGTVAGSQPWDWQPTIFVNDGSNAFSDANTIKLPINNAYSLPLDFIVKDSKIALLAVDEIYSKMAVLIYSYPALSLISSTAVPNADAVWFTLYNGSIVNLVASSSYSITF